MTRHHPLSSHYNSIRNKLHYWSTCASLTTANQNLIYPAAVVLLWAAVPKALRPRSPRHRHRDTRDEFLPLSILYKEIHQTINIVTRCTNGKDAFFLRMIEKVLMHDVTLFPHNNYDPQGLKNYYLIVFSIIRFKWNSLGL